MVSGDGSRCGAQTDMEERHSGEKEEPGTAPGQECGMVEGGEVAGGQDDGQSDLRI